MNNKKSITKVPFTVFTAFATTGGTGANGFPLDASTAPIGTRVQLIADEFELYRFTSLKFRIVGVQTPGTGAVYLMSYLPGVVDATPQFANMNEIPQTCYFYTGAGVATQTVPSDWCIVPRNVLKGSLEWYKTAKGAATDWDEQQGTFRLSTDTVAAGSVWFEMRGVCELMGAADPGSTPAERVLRRQLAERDRLLKLLALQGPAPSITSDQLGRAAKKPG